MSHDETHSFNNRLLNKGTEGVVNLRENVIEPALTDSNEYWRIAQEVDEWGRG